MADETTSPEIASHAARILAMSDAEVLNLALSNPELIRRVAGSALTQAADKLIGERVGSTIITSDGRVFHEADDGPHPGQAEFRAKVDAARARNLAGERPDEREG